MTGAMVQVGLLAIVAVFSLARLSAMQERAREVVERNTRTAALLTKVNDGAGTARESIYKLMTARTPQERKAAASGLEAAGITFVTSMSDLKDSEPDAEFQRALADAASVIARQTPAFRTAVSQATAGARVQDAAELLEPLKSEGIAKLTALATAHKHVAERAIAANQAAYVRSRNVIIVLTVAALLLGWLIGSWLARGVARRARQVVDVATSLAAGHLDARSDISSHDEFGEIGDALNITADNLERMIAKERERSQRLRTSIGTINRFAAQMASGDLSARADVVASGELAALSENLNRMAASLANISGEVRRGTSELSGNASQILAAVSQHNRSSAAQAASIAQTSVTIEEVRNNAEQAAAQASELAERARAAASVSDEGGQAVGMLLAGMDEIGTSVEEIANGIEDLARRSEAIREINETVNDLAEQSNMLALNATIEAAKAGEQGRGFAVVADEVRTLAEQSKQATAQVQAILREIREATAKAVAATKHGTAVVADGRTRASDAGEVIERLTGAIRETAVVAGRIAGGAREQAIGMDQIGRAMVEVSKATDEISQGAGRTESAASNLTLLAARLETTTHGDGGPQEPALQ